MIMCQLMVFINRTYLAYFIFQDTILNTLFHHIILIAMLPTTSPNSLSSLSLSHSFSPVMTVNFYILLPSIPVHSPKLLPSLLPSAIIALLFIYLFYYPRFVFHHQTPLHRPPSDRDFFQRFLDFSGIISSPCYYRSSAFTVNCWQLFRTSRTYLLAVDSCGAEWSNSSKVAVTHFTHKMSSSNQSIQFV